MFCRDDIDHLSRDVFCRDDIDHLSRDVFCRDDIDHLSGDVFELFGRSFSRSKRSGLPISP